MSGPKTVAKWQNIINQATGSKAVRCHVMPIIDGKDTFKEMVRTLKTAISKDHYIYIMGWMLDDDFNLIPGVTLFDLLKDAATKGVEIKVLIWENIIYKKEIQKALKRIHALPYAQVMAVPDSYAYSHPQSQKWLKMILLKVLGIIAAFSKYTILLNVSEDLKKKKKQFEEFETKLRYMLTSQGKGKIVGVGSHHEKVIIVKGKEGLLGFCGGVDINKNRFYDLHDIHCRVGGYAAWELLQKFILRWENIPWQSTVNSNLQLTKSWNYLYSKAGKSWGFLGKKEPKPKATTLKPTLSSVFNEYVKIVGTYTHYTGSSNNKDRSFHKSVLAAINTAQTSIFIEDQYLVNPDVADALNKKLKSSGPDFRLLIIVEDALETDLIIPNKKRGEFISKVKAGIPAKQIQSKLCILMQDSIMASYGKIHKKVHSKIYIIDDELAIIGSANCNHRGFSHDSESAAFIFSNTNYGSMAHNLRLNIWAHHLQLSGSPGYHLNVMANYNFKKSLSYLRKKVLITDYRYRYFEKNPIELFKRKIQIPTALRTYKKRDNDIDQKLNDLRDQSFIWKKLIDKSGLLPLLKSLIPILWKHFIDPKGP